MSDVEIKLKASINLDKYENIARKNAENVDNSNTYDLLLKSHRPGQLHRPIKQEHLLKFSKSHSKKLEEFAAEKMRDNL